MNTDSRTEASRKRLRLGSSTLTSPALIETKSIRTDVNYVMTDAGWVL